MSRRGREERIFAPTVRSTGRVEVNRRTFLAIGLFGGVAMTSAGCSLVGIGREKIDPWAEERARQEALRTKPRMQFETSAEDWERSAAEARGRVEGYTQTLVGRYAAGRSVRINPVVSRPHGSLVRSNRAVTVEMSGPIVQTEVNDGAILSVSYGRSNWDSAQDPERWETGYRARYLVPRFESPRLLSEIISAESTKLYSISAATADRREAVLKFNRAGNSINGQMQPIGIEGAAANYARFDERLDAFVESPIYRVQATLDIVDQAANDLRIQR